MRRVWLLVLLSGAAARAGESFTWDHEGYPRILAAAAEAKTHGKRLLLGLSGAPT